MERMSLSPRREDDGTSTGPAGATAFPTELGWMAIRYRGGAVADLRFGYRSAREALAALGARGEAPNTPPSAIARVIEQLVAYAQGRRVSFERVKVDISGRTPFQARVVAACRAVPYAEVLSYGDLARQVRCPGAARAVGNVMASNRVPIIIPCHRVVGSGGRLGGFSAPGGIEVKARLLRLESGADELAPATRPRRRVQRRLAGVA